MYLLGRKLTDRKLNSSAVSLHTVPSTIKCVTFGVALIVTWLPLQSLGCLSQRVSSQRGLEATRPTAHVVPPHLASVPASLRPVYDEHREEACVAVRGRAVIERHLAGGGPAALLVRAAVLGHRATAAAPQAHRVLRAIHAAQ